MYEVSVDRTRKLVIFRASGTLTAADYDKMLTTCRGVTDSFGGQSHFVLADLRGMGALSPEGANAMSEIIRYGRAHGTVCCMHLSDSSIARLQARRVAREASPWDDVTIDVVSDEEADVVLAEKLAAL